MPTDHSPSAWRVDRKGASLSRPHSPQMSSFPPVSCVSPKGSCSSTLSYSDDRGTPGTAWKASGLIRTPRVGSASRPSPINSAHKSPSRREWHTLISATPPQFPRAKSAVGGCPPGAPHVASGLMRRGGGAAAAPRPAGAHSGTPTSGPIHLCAVYQKQRQPQSPGSRLPRATRLDLSAGRPRTLPGPPLADACDAVAHDATRWRAGAAGRRATRASSRLRALLAGPHLWRRRAGKRGRRASGSPRLRGRSSSWRQPGPASQRQRPLGGQRAPASCPDDLQTGAEHSLASTPVRLLVARPPLSVTGESACSGCFLIHKSPSLPTNSFSRELLQSTR